MVDYSLQFQFHHGNDKSNGQITKGLSTAEKTGPVLSADHPFRHRVGSERELITRPRQLRLECEPHSERAGNGAHGARGSLSWRSFPSTAWRCVIVLTKHYTATHGWMGRWLPLQLPTIPCAQGSTSRGAQLWHRLVPQRAPSAPANCVPTRGMSLASIIAASGRDHDYGRAHASYSQSTRLQRGDRGKEPSGSQRRHALGYQRTKENTKEARKDA
eukprot:6211089-Pleurochrysis_carterae.AAC.1